MNDSVEIDPTKPITTRRFSKLFFIYGPIMIVLLIGGTWLFYHFFKAQTNSPRSLAQTIRTKFQKIVTSPLDGKSYPEEDALRHPVGIMIENHPEARPQTGLTDAAVVYEAQAEGGITRFLAIFGPKLPEKIGPVRSARTYYLDWCLEYDCFYAHVGGNIDALDLIPQLGVKDLDQFRYGISKYGTTYYRVPKKGISKEHTMYVNPAKLYSIAKENNWPEEVSNIGIDYKSENGDRTVDGQQIGIDISSSQYNTIWTYGAAKNDYARTMGGVAHVDAVSGQQIRSKVVIVQEVASRSIVTRINEQGLSMDTTGTGKARIFQDGKVVEGTWKKINQKSRTIFYDQNGNEVRFNPGQRWITIVNPDSKVTVTNP